MFIAKNNNLIVLAKDTQKELEQALQFIVYTSVEETPENYILYNGQYLTKNEIVTLKENQFNKDFFPTSLGYVRRKVSMATGETKDFLSDLLPSISLGLQMGQPVTIITYNKPDFSKDNINWEDLQKITSATLEFVQECFNQLKNDF